MARVFRLLSSVRPFWLSGQSTSASAPVDVGIIFCTADGVQFSTADGVLFGLPA